MMKYALTRTLNGFTNFIAPDLYKNGNPFFPRPFTIDIQRDIDTFGNDMSKTNEGSLSCCGTSHRETSSQGQEGQACTGQDTESTTNAVTPHEPTCAAAKALSYIKAAQDTLKNATDIPTAAKEAVTYLELAATHYANQSSSHKPQDPNLLAEDQAFRSACLFFKNLRIEG